VAGILAPKSGGDDGRSQQEMSKKRTSTKKSPLALLLFPPLALGGVRSDGSFRIPKLIYGAQRISFAARVFKHRNVARMHGG